jgi:hypothetical protein
VRGYDDPKADVLGLVQQRLSTESAGQWLLIIDNADDVEVWFEPVAGSTSSICLVDYLPRSARGAILITTRSRKVAVQMAGNKGMAVPELDKMTAMDLLRKALISPQLVGVVEPAQQLLKQLTFFPLAIVQAAAYINANDTSLAEYLSLLGDADDAVVELLS